MNYLAIAMQYFPYVLAAVQAVEQSISSAPGANKKQLVLDSVTAAASVGTQVPEAHVQVISKLIDTTVGTLNSLGIFGKPAPAK